MATCWCLILKRFDYFLIEQICEQRNLVVSSLVSTHYLPNTNKTNYYNVHRHLVIETFYFEHDKYYVNGMSVNIAYHYTPNSSNLRCILIRWSVMFHLTIIILLMYKLTLMTYLRTNKFSVLLAHLSKGVVFAPGRAQDPLLLFRI